MYTCNYLKSNKLPSISDNPQKPQPLRPTEHHFVIFVTHLLMPSAISFFKASENLLHEYRYELTPIFHLFVNDSIRCSSRFRSPLHPDHASKAQR